MSQRRRKLPAFLSGDRTKTDVFNCNALSLHYLRTVDEVEWGAQCILQRAQEESLIPFVLGFDIEWRVNFRTGMAQPKVALLQLADDTSCYLFHIFHSGLTTSLVKILAAEHILKVGAGVLGDCEKLKVDYGVRVGGVKELGTLANSILHPRASNDRWSLSDLVLRFLRQELLKPKHIRVGNWETKPLRPDQMNYAANDAFAGLQVYKVLAQLRIRKADKHEEREDLEEKVSLSHSFSRVLNTFLGDFQAEKDDWKIHTQQSLSSVLVPPLQLASILSTSQRRSPLSPSSVKTYNLFHLDKLPTTDIASLLAIPVSKVYRHLLSHIFAGKPYDWSCFNIPDESVSLVGVAARILAQEKRRQIVQTRCLTGKQIPSFNKVANRSVDVYTFENIDLKKTSVDTSCLHQRRQSAHIPITMYGVRFEYGRIPEQYIDDLEKYLTPGMVCRDHMKIICAHRVRMNAHSLHDFLV